MRGESWRCSKCLKIKNIEDIKEMKARRINSDVIGYVICKECNDDKNRNTI